MQHRISTIWISWEKHRRTQEIAQYFGIPLFVFSYSGHWIVRYFALSIKTVACLLKQRPDNIMVQNPSIVLTTLALLLRPFMRYKVLVDAHNEAVEPFLMTHPALMKLSRCLLRTADYTIVTNKQLARIVEDAGGTAIILPDRLPAPPAPLQIKTDSAPCANFVLIATYAKDEPIVEILQAFAGLEGKARLTITGNATSFLKDYNKPIPDNITFAGFLSEQEYWNSLYNCTALIDLSLMKNCMVCGAYEGVAAGKPMILSDDPAIKDYFTRGVIYAQPSVTAIQNAVTEVVKNIDLLNLQITKLKPEIDQRWHEYSTQLSQIIS